MFGMREENGGQRYAAYAAIIRALTDGAGNVTEDDSTFRRKTTEQISKRDGEYSELLRHFVKITKIRNRLKEFFKWLFYGMVILSTVALTIIVYRLFNRFISSASMTQITEAIPLLVTAMVGFVSTIIAIPVAITKYLFNTDEDKNITEIILHTQEHDTSGRQWAMEFKQLVKNMEKSSAKKESESACAKSGT